MKKLTKERKRQIAVIAAKTDADMDLTEMPEVVDRSGAAMGWRTRTARAVSARHDRRTKRVVIGLSNRLDVAFDPKDAQGLELARTADLNATEISPSGLGIQFPKLDADLYLPALLEGLLGSRKWMAARWARPADSHGARRSGRRRSRTGSWEEGRRGRVAGRQA